MKLLFSIGLISSFVQTLFKFGSWLKKENFRGKHFNIYQNIYNYHAYPNSYS